jgi:hypothetical protein
MNDEDYIALGKQSNTAELASGRDAPLFMQLEQEDGFEELVGIPFALKNVRDLHVVMRHAVAEAADGREDLTHHPLFHPGFAAFVLGFAIGLAQAQRHKHLGFRSAKAVLSRRQQELCDEWGVQVATYYLAVVDAEGIFGKEADADLYGITDRWRLLGDERRLDEFDRLQECVDAGKAAARAWFEDEDDVPPRFLDALDAFVAANPNRVFG